VQTSWTVTPSVTVPSVRRGLVSTAAPVNRALPSPASDVSVLATTPEIRASSSATSAPQVSGSVVVFSAIERSEWRR